MTGLLKRSSTPISFARIIMGRVMLKIMPKLLESAKKELNLNPNVSTTTMLSRCGNLALRNLR
jgi:hypothetical protein